MRVGTWRVQVPLLEVVIRRAPGIHRSAAADFRRGRWIPAGARITLTMTMPMSRPRPVVHLELHTGDRARASAFYADLLGWRRPPSDAGSYLALDLGAGFGGGVVECRTARPLWLPYVEVDQIQASTEHACLLGASVLLTPREGPAGWRSVVSAPQCGEIALWQPKR